MSRKTILVICGGIAYPALVHSSVILDRPDSAVLIFGGLAILYGIIHFFEVKNRVFRRGAIWISIGGGLIFSAMSEDLSQYALYISPTLITAIILFAFARTLTKEKEPLVTKFARMMTADNLSPEIIVYTRQVTWMWTILLSVIFIECITLPLFASVKVWSFFTNFLNYLIIGAFFIGEYLFRIYRFGRRYSLLHFVRTMSKVSFK